MPQKSNARDTADERAPSIPQDQDDELEMADDDEDFEDDEELDEDSEVESEVEEEGEEH